MLIQFRAFYVLSIPRDSLIYITIYHDFSRACVLLSLFCFLPVSMRSLQILSRPRHRNPQGYQNMNQAHMVKALLSSWTIMTLAARRGVIERHGTRVFPEVVEHGEDRLLSLPNLREAAGNNRSYLPLARQGTAFRHRLR